MIYNHLIRPAAVGIFGEPLLLNLVVLQYMLDNPDEDLSEWL